jgi:hypothetical protein
MPPKSLRAVNLVITCLSKVTGSASEACWLAKALKRFLVYPASSRIKTSHHLWWWYLTGLLYDGK